jgi:hypothetical protein
VSEEGRRTNHLVGVGTIAEFMEGTNKVFGMGLDLVAVTAAYGAVVDGDLNSWSIGKTVDVQILEQGLLVI